MNLRAFVRPLPRVLAFAAFALLAPAAVAQEVAQDEELPVRVGRLADLSGDVYVSSGEQAQDWVEALRNYTVTSGDNLWVSGNGRAEIDYGGGQFRLDGDTNVHVARLDDQVFALFVAHGRAIVRVRVLDAGEVARIDTPNTQITVTRPGLYRVEVSEDRERTDLVVREGEALVALAAGEQQVLPGQSATIAGTAPDQADVRSGFASDGFDQYSASRDRNYERSRTATYVSRQMVGYADLDDNGEWTSYPEYGAVWFPTRVQDDWAPYRYGRWTWVGSYGWTWVDDAPWGYAPFHYGRWAHIGSRWGWIPGGYVARPVWAPALVGWYGGSGWSASVSFGAPVYGWVPLGWGEPYRPSWRCSDRCWSRYNRPYAVNHAERASAPPTRYRNWGAPGATTAVSGAAFTGRRPVHANLVPVRNNLATAPVLAQPPVLARPTAATIPGARPRGNAPPPAERFFRTQPLQVAPGGQAGPGRAGAVAPTWGGGTTFQGPGASSAAPGGVARPTAGVPATGQAPGAVRPRVAAPAATTGSAVPSSRPPQPGGQQTWGAPGATQSVAPQQVAPRDYRPQAGVPPRAINAPAVNPSSGAAVPRSLPPANPSGGAVVPRSLPPAAPSGSAAVPRSAPPAAFAPSRPAPPAAVAPPRPMAPPAAVAPSRPAAPPAAMRSAPAPVSAPPSQGSPPPGAVAPRPAPSGQVSRGAPQGSAQARPAGVRPVPQAQN